MKIFYNFKKRFKFKFIKKKEKEKMSKEVSVHMSYEEVTFSQTAIRNSIDNEPSVEQLERIKKLATNVFELLREWVGGPIKINSVFRSSELNKRIGGSKSSQHCANKGAAADLDDTFGHKTNAEMFHYIKDNLTWDQLIWEYGDETNPNWVHVSYNENNNRGEILIAYRNDQGKARYKFWDKD